MFILFRDAWKQYVVDHERKLVYAWIPKVMSSTMFYAMIQFKTAFRKFHPNLTPSTKDAFIFYGTVSISTVFTIYYRGGSKILKTEEGMEMVK